MNERAQLRVIAKRDDPIGLDSFRDNALLTMTQMCSLRIPTTASWCNGSCNGPATLFKTMSTQYGSFGKMEVSVDHLEPDKNPVDKKLEFYGERSSVTFYKQKRKRNFTALLLLGEKRDVDTDIDVPLKKEQNVAQRPNPKLKSLSIGCTENIKNR